MRVSYIIPVFNNFNLTKHIYENLVEYFPDDEIVISDGGSTDKTIEYFSKIDNINLKFISNGLVNLSQNYNIGVKNATTNIVILLHNDMFVPPSFKDKLLVDLEPNIIISFSRIEPPIFPGEEPGKIIRDFGTTIENLNKEAIIKFTNDYNLKFDGGGLLFTACYKNNYLFLDETTYNPPQMWCADDDLNIRYRLNGFKCIISDACVYHLVSQTSRQGNYQQIEMNSNRNFIRKWSSMNSDNRFNVGFIIKNCTNDLLYHLEPWCDTIYADYRFAHTIEPYIIKEQPNTSFNLYDRIKPYDNEKNNDILVSFDGSKLDNNQFEIIRNLQNILGNTSPGETYEIGIFNIYVHSLNNNIKDLIFIHK